MYETFYGLRSKPFQLNPDPSFYYGSTQHRRARAYLEYGVMRAEGFIVITGEVGAGKTTTVRGLLESIDVNTVVAAQLVSTQLGAEDTLRLVGAAFGVRVKDLTKAELLMGLEAFFIAQAAQNKRCLLIVDEAQNLTPTAVEELRMLSNFQFGNKALLQTFLVGQPEFRVILQSPDMVQLRQRVVARCHLGPMSAEETRAYIEHRLKCAGSSGAAVFDDVIFARIHEESGGIPRRINTLCDRLLLCGFLSEARPIGESVLDGLLHELKEEQAPPPMLVATSASTMHSGAFLLNGEAVLPPPQPGAALADPAGHFSAEALMARIQKLERSLLRQERMSLEILHTVQKLTREGGTS